MKRFIVVNLSLFCLIVLCNVFRLYGLGDYFCLYLHQKKLCGVGKTDNLNRKNGKWVYFYPQSGNIRSFGEYVDNAKENLWIGFYDNQKWNNRYYETIYKQGKVDGVLKTYDINSETADSYFCKNGICYLKEINFHYLTIDYIPSFANEINFIESLYKQEFGDSYDSEWNHKPYSDKLNKSYRISNSYKLDEYDDYEPYMVNQINDINLDDLPAEVDKLFVNEYANIINILELFLLTSLVIYNFFRFVKLKNAQN